MSSRKAAIRFLCVLGLLAIAGIVGGIFDILRAQGATQHSIALTWNPDSTATGGFNVYRATVAAGPFTKIATVAAGVDTYSDTTGVGGTAYYYEVTALDTATPPDESGPSNVVGPLTFLGNPTPPTGLAGVAK
jgi:fibronectin type 3 domain-containing protein